MKKDFIAIGLTALWLIGFNSLNLYVPLIKGSPGFWYDFGVSLGPVVLFGSVYTAYRIWKYRKSIKIKTA